MKISEVNQLSVLSCSTGLALAAIFFVVLGFGEAIPDWLPMAVAAIGGFELFIYAQQLAKRRRNRNG
ncbi:MAG: hypothetical protein ACTHKM_07465 [Tsuneonella sp.]